MSDRATVWVVFSGRSDLWRVKLFRPGFRHCYVLIRDRWQWVSIDPLSHYTQILFHAHMRRDFDLPAWLRGQGDTVIEATIAKPPQRCAPVMVFTCVEAVKRMLGIHRRGIFTPWQLYRHLTHQQASTKEKNHGQCYQPAQGAGPAGRVLQSTRSRSGPGGVPDI